MFRLESVVQDFASTSASSDFEPPYSTSGRGRAGGGALDPQQRDALLQMVMTRLPGLMFDVLALLEDSEPPRVPDGGVLQWCTCSNCREMSTDLERLGCRQTPETCVSNMAHMRLYILDERVLRLARAARNDIFVIEDDQESGVEQRENRHSAYCQFVLWQHGLLGVGNRVVIPRCCVWRIRDTFPDFSRQGTVYSFPDPM
uniref:P2X purinoreceptor 7 intracellular domain-containing protein n=1 Tax=Scophthalmus maximus TaxID=52904 RepID=A0A8D2ZW89_SCOMX